MCIKRQLYHRLLSYNGSPLVIVHYDYMVESSDPALGAFMISLKSFAVLYSVTVYLRYLNSCILCEN